MYSGDDEQREIIEYFKSSFSGEKNVPKLLYGTGKITEILLDLKQEYNIVGVVDSNYNGKTFCEVPVFDLLTANKYAVKLIIVAKRYNAIKVYERISEQLVNIDIVDIGNKGFFVDSANSIYESVNAADKYCIKLFSDKGIIKNKEIRNNLSWNEIGYYLYGPLAVGYVMWIRKQALSDNPAGIAFIARDGYILKAVWDVLQKKNTIDVKAEYVLGSRSFYSLISLHNEKQLVKAMQKASLKYTNTEMLAKRFDIIAKCQSDDALTIGQITEKYGKNILNNAEKQRGLYSAYLHKLGMDEKNVTLVDLVSSGTIPQFYNKAFDAQCGLYALALSKFPDHSDFDEIDAKSYMGEILMYAPPTGLMRTFATSIIEGVFTAPHGCFQSFADDGAPQYIETEKSQQNMEILSNVHQGILDFAEDISNLCDEEISIEFINAIWSKEAYIKQLHIEKVLSVSDTF